MAFLGTPAEINLWLALTDCSGEGKNNCLKNEFYVDYQLFLSHQKIKWRRITGKFPFTISTFSSKLVAKFQIMKPLAERVITIRLPFSCSFEFIQTFVDSRFQESLNHVGVYL